MLPSTPDRPTQREDYSIHEVNMAAVERWSSWDMGPILGGYPDGSVGEASNS